MNLRKVRRAAVAGIGVAVAGLTIIPTTSTSAGFGHGRPLSADMTGAAVVPGPGDPDGTGRAQIRVSARQGEICYEVSVAKITPSTEAHIEFGPAGASGPVVAQFVPPGPEVILSTGEVTGGRSSGCTFIEPAVAKDIIKNPDQYYVIVYNAGFLSGAVRGQLG